MQLSLLAAENAALKAKLTEREQAAQLEMQDLRKFCIASQDKDSESWAFKELQEQQQQMMSHLSTVESLASQVNASTQLISNRLDKVIPRADTWHEQQSPVFVLNGYATRLPHAYCCHLCCHSYRQNNGCKQAKLSNVPHVAYQ